MIAILFIYWFVICLFQTFPPRSPSYSPFYLLIICRPKLCRGSSGPWWAASWRRTPYSSPSGRFWTPSKSEDLYLVLYILNLTFQTNHDIWHWDIWQPGRGCGVPASDLGLQIRLPQRVAWWAEIILQPSAANNYLHSCSCHTQASPTATRGCSSSWVCSWPTRPGVSRYKCEGLSEKILSICFVLSCRCYNFIL